MLPLLRVRYAQWAPLLSLTSGDLDASRDGVMAPPGTAEWGEVVVKYARLMALAAQAERGRVVVGAGAGGAAASQLKAEDLQA